MLPIFNFFGFKIYSYALLLGIAWSISYTLLKENLKFNKFHFFGIFICAWLGAKILFLITLPTHYSNLLQTNANFWLGGGFVFFGGLLGGLLFILFLKVKYKYKFSDFNYYVPALLIGHGIGRVGCFLAGCCFGVQINNFMLPVQLIESFFTISLGVYALKKSLNIERYLMYYASFRFVIEFFRGDIIRGQYLSLSTSQLISLIIIFVFVFKRFQFLFLKSR